MKIGNRAILRIDVVDVDNNLLVSITDENILYENVVCVNVFGIDGAELKFDLAREEE